MKTKKLKAQAINFSLIALSLIFLQSCGNEPPVFNNENDPFIVGEISCKNKSHSIYYKNKVTGNGSSFFGSWYEAVVLPSGAYNIGDTIRFVSNKK